MFAVIVRGRNTVIAGMSVVSVPSAPGAAPAQSGMTWPSADRQRLLRAEREKRREKQREGDVEWQTCAEKLDRTIPARER